MPPIMESADYDQLNELRVANSRALNEFMIYVGNAKSLDSDRYRLLLADVELTWARFSECARKPLRRS